MRTFSSVYIDIKMKEYWASILSIESFLFLTVLSNPLFVFPSPVLAELPPALTETLKNISVPHTPEFLTYHGELLEHHLELAPKCFACHTEKRTFCVSCHAVVYEREEAGESDEAESEDWERLGLDHEDIEEDWQIFKQLGIPLYVEPSE